MKHMTAHLRLAMTLVLLTASLSACQRPGAQSPPAATPIPVTESLDLPYAEVEGVDPNLLSLDVYAPVPAADLPVLVMIHGGGWRMGDKANHDVGVLKSRLFTSQGFVYVSINYRLSPAVMHPVHVQDVAAALAWVLRNIRLYGGDPDSIFVMGHSAGAHLAALVATDERYLQANGLGLGILQGVILLDGAGYDIPYIMDRQISILPSMYGDAFGSDPAVWEDASPVNHVAPGKDIPPFLLFHAGLRVESRVSSRKLADLLEGAGVPAWVVAAPGKTHGSINTDIGKPGDPVMERILEFLADVRLGGGLRPRE